MKRERPAILVRKSGRSLAPVSQLDEEQLDALPADTEFMARPLTRRSLPQLRLYWLALTRVVAATEIAPSAAHLHDLLKDELGYVTLVKTWDGSVQRWPDSTALDKMRADEFRGYFDRAMRLLAERVGFDPLTGECA